MEPFSSFDFAHNDIHGAEDSCSGKWIDPIAVKEERIMNSLSDLPIRLTTPFDDEKDTLKKIGIKKARLNPNNFQTVLNRYQSLLPAHFFLPEASIQRTLRANHAHLLLFEKINQVFLIGSSH